MISNIYGQPKQHKRYKLWDFIKEVDDSMHPWLLIGDFNQVFFSRDKWQGSSKIRGNDMPIDTFHSKNLLEITSKGNSFTWSNNRKGDSRILEKLDRG